MVRPEVKKRLQERAAAEKQSHKKRKLLEKVVTRRKLKSNRVELLAQLKKCRLSKDQIEQMHSTSSMQTKGLKRFLQDNHAPNKIKLNVVQRAEACLDASALIKRKRRKVNNVQAPPEDPSSSSEDTDDISTDSDSNQSQQDTDPEQEHTTSHEIPENEKPQSETIDTTCGKQISNQDTQTINHTSFDLKSEVFKSTTKASPKKSSSESTDRKPAIFVEVHRKLEIQISRLELPIINCEQNIIEKIKYNDVVIITGQTGSGKTTQIPQFLYEAGYTSNNKTICITEPRRVAAVSMSERVADELNMTPDQVSYQIRFSGNVSEKTVIKFVTDGVLMRECQKDFLLTRYSVIIIDEAHERSVFSDILIGLLSRIVPLRKKKGDPLKLVIMSATLKLEDFTNNKHLFKISPPTINIEARQYPVSIHFSKKTPENYLEAAYKKVRVIDSKMPKGGILVFVTSQMDVKVLCKKLRCPKLHCIGLYALMPLEKQKLVFKSPPEGRRLCVIATNVAETSITIPNIKYVVDSGKEKTKQYNLATGVSRFETRWTSKSSANQRTGRAGRMGPGHCYRLYSSAVFTNDFMDHSRPSILQRPVEDIVLQMKSMNIDNVVNFPFPTRPSEEVLKRAEAMLIKLGALDDEKYRNARYSEMLKLEYKSTLTPLGRKMSAFAVSPRCSKMIVLATKDIIYHVIALVSAITVREMFLEGPKWIDIKKKWSGHGDSKLLGDFMVMIRAIQHCDSKGYTNKICDEFGLRTKAMLEIHKLRIQLVNESKTNLKLDQLDTEHKIKKPTEIQAKNIRHLLLSSYCDHVARKISGYITIKDPNDPSKTIKKKLNHAYETLETKETVYISSDSIIKGEKPVIVIFQELYNGDNKTYMRNVASIDPNWISEFGYKL